MKLDPIASSTAARIKVTAADLKAPDAPISVAAPIVNSEVISPLVATGGSKKLAITCFLLLVIVLVIIIYLLLVP